MRNLTKSKRPKSGFRPVETRTNVIVQAVQTRFCCLASPERFCAHTSYFLCLTDNYAV